MSPETLYLSGQLSYCRQQAALTYAVAVEPSPLPLEICWGELYCTHKLRFLPVGTLLPCHLEIELIYRCLTMYHV